MSYRLRCDACGAESDATPDASWTHIEVSRGLVKRDLRPRTSASSAIRSCASFCCSPSSRCPPDEADHPQPRRGGGRPPPACRPDMGRPAMVRTMIRYLPAGPAGVAAVLWIVFSRRVCSQQAPNKPTQREASRAPPSSGTCVHWPD